MFMTSKPIVFGPTLRINSPQVGPATFIFYITPLRGPGGSLSLTCSKMSLHVFVMKGMEGYQMLFTGSKNIVPSLSYRDFKFGFYIRLHCGHAL